MDGKESRNNGRNGNSEEGNRHLGREGEKGRNIRKESLENERRNTGRKVGRKWRKEGSNEEGKS